MEQQLHYTFRVGWSPDDQEFVGTCLEFPSLSWLSESHTGALDGIWNLVNEVVQDLSASGEEVPEPLADRHYSGNLSLRLTPDLHRKVSIEAADQGVSVNKYLNEKLASC